MKRFRRWLFNVLAGLSMLLGVATAAIWVRSYWHMDVLGGHGRERASHWQRGGSFSSGSGMFWVEWWLRDNRAMPPASEVEWEYESWPLNYPLPKFGWHGFGCWATISDWPTVVDTSNGHATPMAEMYSHQVSAPHWFVALMFALAVSLRMRPELRRRRMEFRSRHNLCLSCGYDLRATPDRCPECGTIPKKADQFST